MRAFVVLALGLALAPAAQAAKARLLYSGDWSGSREIYSVDPARGSLAQVTFGHDPSCDPLVVACGYFDVLPSPNGRRIAFQTEDGNYCDAPGSLYVARPDGSARRRVVRFNSFLCPEVVWSPDSRHLAYVLNPKTVPVTYVVHDDGSGNQRVGYGDQPAWSPDGRSLALVDNHVLWIRKFGRFHTVVRDVGSFAWSPTGKSIAVAGSTLRIVEPDGSELAGPLPGASPSAVSWSRDGRFIAYSAYGTGSEIVDVTTGRAWSFDEYSEEHAWSHRGDRLVFASEHGLSVFDPARGTTTVLTSHHSSSLAWAPDDRSIAYLDGDLRVVTLAGTTRTVVDEAGTAGGLIGSLAWITPKGKLRYRRVGPRNAATVSADHLVAPWPIEHIATDGEHVLYTTCAHLFLWTPAMHDVVQEEATASLTPECSTPGNYRAFDVYDIALAGERIAFGTHNGNMSQGWDLYEQPLAHPAAVQQLADAYGFAICTVGNQGLGDLAGAGNLLVFSRWQESRPPDDSCGSILSQQIERVDDGACPCPEIATSPGPLLPTDVNDDRVVALGTNETEVLDSKGKLLLAVPVHAAAAQLTGSNLVVVVQGQLRDYDATTGALLHAWPLPDVPSGSPCASPHPEGCPSVRFELEDASRDLAAYVLNGYLHVMQFVNGTDQTVATSATTARFIDTGLVYADGNELHLVTYDKLPCC